MTVTSIMPKAFCDKLNAELSEHWIPYNKFAANNAGGDWEVILELIGFYFKDHNVKIYKL